MGEASSLQSERPNDATAESELDYEASNFLKHTSQNPIQRRLIDRFHATIGNRIVELAPASFLDAGCGEGFVAKMLQERMPGIRLTGFDFNPAAVRLAAKANPQSRFVTASVFALPYADDRFDVVGCFEVLEHQADPLPALRELVRVARQAVVLSVPHEPFFSWANAARGKNWDIRPRGSDPDHRQLWSRAAFGAFVSQELEVTWLGGSFPWTICVGRKRDGKTGRREGISAGS